MPVFPQFAQRLAQFNNPMQRQPGQPDDGQQQPMDLGQGQRMYSPGINPMNGPQPPTDSSDNFQNNMPVPALMPRSNPMQRSGSELPAPSGTGGDAVGGTTPARTMKTKIYENVAKEVRYEDIAPKMEVVPGMPPFQPKPGGGVWNHLKSAAQGFAGAAALSNNNPLAAIAGGVAGAIKPEMGQDMAYRGITVPKAQAQQKQVMGRNADRQAQFHLALQDRVAVNKMNEANQPEYMTVPGAEYPAVVEKHSGEQTLINGPDGKPQRASSVVNTNTRVDSTEEIKANELAAKIRMQQEKVASSMNELTEKIKAHSADVDAVNKTKIEIAGMQAQLKKYLQGIAEGGKDKRSKVVQDEKDRTERKSRAEAVPNYKTKDDEFGPSMSDPQTDYQKKNGMGLPPTSGTGKKSNRRQLPPPSGTSPN